MISISLTQVISVDYSDALFCLKNQVALVALATIPSSHKDLLSAVKSWPPAIYSALPVIAAIVPQLNTSSMTDQLKEVRASKCSLHLYASELYIKHVKTLSLFAVSGTGSVV